MIKGDTVISGFIGCMISFIRFTCPYLVTKFNLTNVKVFIFDKDRDMLKTGVKFATFPLLSYLATFLR